MGEITIAASVWFHFVPQVIAASPPLARPEPAIAPMRACEELEGMPNHQVIRFQAMAPSSAAKIRLASSSLTSMKPLPTAFATAVPVVNAAMKLKTAAHKTALSGESTRVPTIAAIELAES